MSLWLLSMGSYAQVNPSKVGHLDLRYVDFEAGETATLNTTWRFFFNEFVPPSVIKAKESQSVPITVPSSWGYLENTSDQGYATYSLEVLLPNSAQALGLKVPEMATSYMLFVNGRLVAKVGEVGKTKAKSSPQTVPLVVQLNPNEEVVTIVFHIANFHHKKSGLWDTITIGSYEKIREIEQKNYFYAVFLIGAIFLIGLYHVGLFLLNRKDHSTIFFSLFAFATVLRILSTGDMPILTIFPQLPWEWRLTFDHVSMYMVLGFGVLFSYSLFPKEVKKAPTAIIAGVSLVFSLIGLFTSGIINSYFVVYFQVFILLSLSYLTYAFFMAFKHKREGGTVYAVGYAVLCLTAMHDVFYALNIIHSMYFLPVGALIFFLSQALVLAIRSAKAFSVIEQLSTELKSHNQRLEEQVVRRTRVIAKKNDELQEINENLQERELQLEEKANDLEKVNSDLKFAQTQLKTALKKEKDTNKQLEQTLHKLQEAQDFLVQSEKMASLGQLTAGIAHEINNPINFIAVGVDCLEPLIHDVFDLVHRYESLDNKSADEMKALLQEVHQLKAEIDYDGVKEDIIQLLTDVKEGVNRTIEIVIGLRDFSRSEQSGKTKAIDIHQCIDSSLLILKNQYKHRIELIKEYDLAIPAITCKAGQINQVLVNLISNAIQAIEGPGQIEIKTTQLDKETMSIRLKDSGQGIPKDVLQKIFDPFFTTKEVGVGTGLGLSISHGIIANHGGNISVTSQVGLGTEFVITLPINGLPKSALAK